MADKNELTPMKRQYNKIKSENPNSILFFRLGDFYEEFFEEQLKKDGIKKAEFFRNAITKYLEEKAE